MSQGARVGSDAETPVNPYSLLEAVNSASGAAHTAWLIFLGLMAYLTIAVAGVTHKDLLLETPVALPIMQVSIQQALFFEFAPVLLVLFHLGVVSQFTLVARKMLEFDYAVRALELTDQRAHPLRLELHNFFFVQATAGPHRSAVMSVFLHAMSWLTLVVLPLGILLFIQISYLPYHDVTITWVHRICVAADIVMLALIGIFLVRTESSFVTALMRALTGNPVSSLGTLALMAGVLVLSFLVATIPGEPLDRIVYGQGAGERRLAFVQGRADGSITARFSRNLVVSDADLARSRDGRDSKPEDVSINLRGRDLRFARLDRSDLNRADLTGANLEGASLIGADLTHARLGCADITEFILSQDRSKAKCVDARGANFTRAKLSNARMAGIDLSGGRLEEATLEGADLSYASAIGADFASAHLEKAVITGGAQLQGANLLIASLQGAEMTGVQLQGADLSSAGLQGAVLTHANLTGAKLRDADLEGAELLGATLWRADMTGAKLRAADLRGVSVWMTTPPSRDGVALADLGGLSMKPLETAEGAALAVALGKLGTGRAQTRVREVVEPLVNPAESPRWGSSADRQAWQALVTLTAPSSQDGYAKDLTEHLSGLMCKARFANASVATGIAKRAQGSIFRGNISAIHDRLRGECFASEAMSPRLMQRLATAVDTAAGK